MVNISADGNLKLSYKLINKHLTLGSNLWLFQGESEYPRAGQLKVTGSHPHIFAFISVSTTKPPIPSTRTRNKGQKEIISGTRLANQVASTAGRHA